jgi:hypothetical protein
MSEPRIASNVYYLPVQAASTLLPVDPPPAPSWRTVVAHTIWRLRFAIAEIRHVFRTPVPVMPNQDYPFLIQGAEMTARRSARPTVPARVIDFSAARLRLRPV